MNTLAERVKYAREQKGLSQHEVADKANISQPTYFKIENGLTQKPRNILDIATALNVNPQWLATGQGEMTPRPTHDELMTKMQDIITHKQANPQSTQILSTHNPTPVISWVVAGSWDNATDGITLDSLGNDVEYLPRPIGLSPQGFCLKVRGESMLPEFRPDEYIYVEPMIDVGALKNGDLVVVRESDKNEATFKQLVLGDTSDEMYLRPLNPDWHEQKMIPKSDWYLVGKVVGKWVKY